MTNLYMIRVASGHDWLVEAASAEEALADWPEDAEEAISAEVASVADATYAQEQGESDVSDSRFEAWMRMAVL